MFRSIDGPSSGSQELRSMQIHVTFMEVLQLDGIPSVLQFEIRLYITIKSCCIYNRILLLYTILFQIVKPKGSHRVATLP